MRLIDITEFFKSLTDHESVSGILTKLSKQPTIDAVPVVRCWECVHRDGTPGQPNILCGQMHDDDFCSYGQRKEADHETVQ